MGKSGRNSTVPGGNAHPCPGFLPQKVAVAGSLIGFGVANCREEEVVPMQNQGQFLCLQVARGLADSN